MKYLDVVRMDGRVVDVSVEEGDRLESHLAYVTVRLLCDGVPTIDCRRRFSSNSGSGISSSDRGSSYVDRDSFIWYGSGFR